MCRARPSGRDQPQPHVSRFLRPSGFRLRLPTLPGEPYSGSPQVQPYASPALVPAFFGVDSTQYGPSYSSYASEG